VSDELAIRLVKTISTDDVYEHAILLQVMTVIPARKPFGHKGEGRKLSIKLLGTKGAWLRLEEQQTVSFLTDMLDVSVLLQYSHHLGTNHSTVHVPIDLAMQALCVASVQRRYCYSALL
jgi:hypothetical protein